MSRPGALRRYCALLALVSLIAQTSIHLKAVSPLAVVTSEVLELLLARPGTAVPVMLRGDIPELTRVASRLASGSSASMVAPHLATAVKIAAASSATLNQAAEAGSRRSRSDLRVVARR
jgi:hypothetical protein